MKPIKQLVYLPVKEYKNYTVSYKLEAGVHDYVELRNGYFFSPEQLNEYTANVIKQALETAAESKAL